MKSTLLFATLLTLLLPTSKAQQIDIEKLNQLFNSLEQRNEAMGSIAISKNGNLLYSRAIGYRLVSDTLRIPADANTTYRIWSVTKVYTATMIMQLIEEGKLALQTPLYHFFSGNTKCSSHNDKGYAQP